MAYSYLEQRKFIFTDEGQRTFLKIRDRAKFLCDQSGAFTVGKVIETIGGDSWVLLACIDRLVELGEYHFVREYGGEDATQDQVLTR